MQHIKRIHANSGQWLPLGKEDGNGTRQGLKGTTTSSQRFSFLTKESDVKNLNTARSLTKSIAEKKNQETGLGPGGSRCISLPKVCLVTAVSRSPVTFPLLPKAVTLGDHKRHGNWGWRVGSSVRSTGCSS